MRSKVKLYEHNSIRGSLNALSSCLKPFLHNEFLDTDVLCINYGSEMININIKLLCRGGIIVDVVKKLQILQPSHEAKVFTKYYSYNASVQGFGSILRFDNARHHLCHSDEHHRH